MRLKFSETDSLRGDGVNEPFQFVDIVNVGHEALRHFRNCCRQGNMMHETAAGCVPVEAAQRVILAAPVSIHTTGARQESLHLVGSNLVYVTLHAHVPTKSVQQAFCALKLSSH